MDLKENIMFKIREANTLLPIKLLLFELQDGDMSCPFCGKSTSVTFIKGVFQCWRCKTAADEIGLVMTCKDLSAEEAVVKFLEMAEEHKETH